ncbi:MAG: amino acid permease [Bacteroidota bacterium]|nr:amino acid permease [Bacteroidota bacterium]MDP3147253.1 amino acid permease [Bacteroidota bacterium]MDP3557373.1 amino acid permease [Bacteroidota bacterium]
MQAHKIGFNTAVSIVIANMIGTGVFTSLGFQVLGIESGFAIIMLWVVGGILALCGALTYGEIGAAFPQSGGEYNYLSKLYHPAVGFVSGWVSVTVGFAAPIAAAAVALGHYVNKVYPGVNPILLALSVIASITVIHSINLKAGSLFQRVFTIVKVVCILMFVGFGLFHVPEHSLNLDADKTAWNDIFSKGFAVSLIYVTYAYSGWNAASYISGEMLNPKRNLPKALFIGTLIVMIIYTLLNYVFLYSVPIPELKGVLEVGYLSANKIFGSQVGQFMSLIIALLLISTISAMVLAGPRVMQSMGNDIKGLKFFAISNKNKVPYVAIIFQSVIAVVLVLTSSFESLITYVGFTLNLFTFLTVAGIFILRYKHKQIVTSYKTFLYPVTPLLFLSIILFILINIMIEKPVESLYGFGTVVLGLIVYFLTNKKENKTKIIVES